MFVTACGRRQAESSAVTSLRLRQALEQGLDSLGTSLDRLARAVDATSDVGDGSAQAAIGAFRDARVAYKRIEVLLEPYGPAVVEQLNGPVEIDDDHSYRPLNEPAGFQVLEDALFGGQAAVGRDSLEATVRAMRRSVTALRPLTVRLTLTETNLLDALRIEVARISTLGIAGFDSPRSGDAIVESAVALEGAQALVETVEPFGASCSQRAQTNGRSPWCSVDSALGVAAAYLRAHSQFDPLDRLEFIVGYGNPLAQAIATARRTLPAPPSLRRLWRQSAMTVFEPNAFDASAFASVDAPPTTPQLVALGRRLFFDPVLSGPRTRSCAFCHDPRRAFTDGRAQSMLLGPSGGPHRNTPTLLGAAYEPVLFDDLRAQSLEMQAGMVLANQAEMASSAELVAKRVRADASYRAAFAQAFPMSPDSATTSRAVRAALAAYVRSLTTLDAPFDRAVRGDTNALSAEQRLGFTTFMGKARCGTCHFIPLFSGTMPPEFVSSDAEIIGVPDRADANRPRVDPDSGLAGADFQSAHRGAFKVPTLRNVELTAPYMHNGTFKSLDAVVEFYDHGGGAGAGLRVPNQTLPSDSLHLSATEKRALEAFLRTLTSDQAAQVAGVRSRTR
jgi:cytochrome c peroxidase